MKRWGGVGVIRVNGGEVEVLRDGVDRGVVDVEGIVEVVVFVECM